MFQAISIKARLYAIAAVTLSALIVFAAIDVYTARQGAASLSSVYEHQVEPMAALLELDHALKEVRFRMTGYLLDQLPAVGNRNHLREARDIVPAAWARFRDKTRANSFSDDDRALIERIDANISAVQPFFAKLDSAYAQDDPDAVAPLLEDEWPYAVHATLLKPVSRLLPAQQHAVRSEYQRSVVFGQRMIALGIVALGLLAAITLGLVGRVSATITRPLATAVGIARRIARGEMQDRIDIQSHDEIGQLLEAIVDMRRQVHARQKRLETILDNAAEGIITFDHNGIIEGFNISAEKLFGYTVSEVIGKDISVLMPPPSHERRKSYLEHFMRTEIQRLIGHEGEARGRHKDGTVFPMALKVSEMQLQGRGLYTALVADISERKALIDSLKAMAEHDALTGLYNRSYFVEELERVVERARRADQRCALLHIDLDNFKYINDIHGYAAGDGLIIAVAGILQKRARSSDLVARLGGDEFTVLLYDTDGENVSQVAESFRSSFDDFRFDIGKESVEIGCSIGAARISQHTQSAAEVMAQADIACHIAKRAGRNRAHVFQPTDADKVTTMALDMGWSRRIRHAIQQDRFVLACQPIVSTRTRRVEVYEILLRMLDDDGEMIMPAGFLPSAERFGLMVDIDRWVIAHAIEALARQHELDPDIRYSINLSGKTLSDLSVCDLIKETLAGCGVSAAALTFEVTETVAIADMAAAVAFLSRVQALGCKTSLDDFGSGMSSFAYLKDLPVDCIKIDGRFVKNLAASRIDQAMVRAMKEIAGAMEKETVAEFVENEESFRLLAEIGVDCGQGYHLGRPDLIRPPAKSRAARR